jgi:hypothetical protein
MDKTAVPKTVEPEATEEPVEAEQEDRVETVALVGTVIHPTVQVATGATGVRAGWDKEGTAVPEAAAEQSTARAGRGARPVAEARELRGVAV